MIQPIYEARKKLRWHDVALVILLVLGIVNASRITGVDRKADDRYDGWRERWNAQAQESSEFTTGLLDRLDRIETALGIPKGKKSKGQ